MQKRKKKLTKKAFKQLSWILNYRKNTSDWPLHPDPSIDWKKQIETSLLTQQMGLRTHTASGHVWKSCSLNQTIQVRSVSSLKRKRFFWWLVHKLGVLLPHVTFEFGVHVSIKDIIMNEKLILEIVLNAQLWWMEVPENQKWMLHVSQRLNGCQCVSFLILTLCFSDNVNTCRS